MMGYSVPMLLFVLLAPSPLFLFSNATPIDLQSLPTMSFDESFTKIFGESNIMLLRDGRNVSIALDERTGSGFVSHDLYMHGFFSASIKLPSDYTAGVVVAFYTSNEDLFKKTHDELDFEFLGCIRGKQWRVQTNVFGNGTYGREERYDLPFDPTEDFHHYSILWTSDRIIFYIDNIAIREVARESMGSDFPSKPMSLYATIWDGSGWATQGGRFKVIYKYAPYIAEFTDLVLHGCAVDPMDLASTACDGGDDYVAARTMSTEQRLAMKQFRRVQMSYSYCYDRLRNATPPPECQIDRRTAERLRTGGRRFSGHRHHRHRRSYYRRPAGQADAAL